MPPVKEGRVTKRTPSSAAGTRLRRADRDRKAPKALPLVERTNNLALEEFTSSYIPTSLLEMKTPSKPGIQTADHTLDIYTAQTIPGTEFEACFKLIETSSAADYTAAGVGWSPAKKRREMRLPDMRYLILRRRGGAEDGEVVGFLSFMVTYEDGREVIYCYEIHLSPTVQGQGLGGLLMARYEEIGRRVGLEKAMLTVFKSNERAWNFYKKLRYGVDEFSPLPRKLRNGTTKEPEYLILSKLLQEPGFGEGQGAAQGAAQI